MNDGDASYTQHLISLEGAWWKRFFSVQAPYRWNLRRLRPGFVLEIGCGIGRNLIHLDGNGVGVDHNPYSVAICRDRKLSAFLPEEFASSEFAVSDRFDSLLFAHVAEHMTFSEFVILLGNYTKFLRTDGAVILITPQEAGFHSEPAAHVEFMDFEKHADALRETGLTPERAYSFPFPRWAGRYFRHNEFVTIARKRQKI